MTDQMHMEQYVVGMVATNCYLIYHTQTKEALLIDPGAEAQRLMDEMARLKVTPVAVLLTHRMRIGLRRLIRFRFMRMRMSSRHWKIPE